MKKNVNQTNLNLDIHNESYHSWTYATHFRYTYLFIYLFFACYLIITRIKHMEPILGSFLELDLPFTLLPVLRNNKIKGNGNPISGMA